MDDFFAAVPEPDRQAAEALSLRRLEERVLAKVLAFYNLEDLAAGLRRRCRSATGHGGLLFAHFLEECPSFPAYLSFARVPYLHRLTMADWLTRFTRTPAFVEFDRRLDEIPEPYAGEGRPLAMVFPLNNMGTGLACLSNCDRPLGDGNSRIARLSRGVLYVFEPFVEFLAGLAWSP